MNSDETFEDDDPVLALCPLHQQVGQGWDGDVGLVRATEQVLQVLAFGSDQLLGCGLKVDDKVIAIVSESTEVTDLAHGLGQALACQGVSSRQDAVVQGLSSGCHGVQIQFFTSWMSVM